MSSKVSKSVVAGSKVSVKAPGKATAKATAKAFAKVNLFLKILDVDAAGMHTLQTVYARVDSLFDQVSVEAKFVREPGLAIALKCKRGSNKATKPEVKEVPLDETNIAHQAVELVYSGILWPNLFPERGAMRGLAVNVSIEKDIPVCAGLAGGSADAAATIIAANKAIARALDLEPLTYDELLSIARQLGSDVPFALYAAVDADHHFALGTHYGENIEPISADVKLHFAFNFHKGEGNPTPAIYHQYDILHIGHQLEPATNDVYEFIDALQEGSPAEIEDLMFNDLEIPAIVANESLRETLRKLALANPDQKYFISGSGPTVFSLTKPTSKKPTSRLAKSGSKAVSRSPKRDSKVKTSPAAPKKTTKTSTKRSTKI